MDDLEDLDIARITGAWYQPSHSSGGVRIALVYFNGTGGLRGSGFDFPDRESARSWFDESFPGVGLDELHSQWADRPANSPDLTVIL